MVASGASKKALDHFDERAEERQAQNAHRLNAQVHTMAGIEATNNFEKLTDSAAGLAAASPGDLDNILQGWRSDVNHAMGTGVLSPEAAKAMGPKAIEAQRRIITQALDAKARSGPEGMNQYMQDIHDPKYAPFIGTKIDALVQHGIQIAREERVEQRLQQEDADRAEKKEADARVGEYNQNRKPGDPMYDMSKDPYAKKNPEWGARMEAVNKADRDYQLHNNQPDPQLADKRRGELFDDLIVGGKAQQDPDAAQAAVDKSYGKHEISKVEHQELTGQINNAARPENSALNRDRTSFFGPQGYGPSLTGPSIGGLGEYKPEAAAATHAAKNYAAQREDDIRQGKVAESKDPRDLYKEGSKVFLGTDPSFTKYFRSLDQNIDAATNAMTGKQPTPQQPTSQLPPGMEKNQPAALDYIRKLPPGTVVQTPWGPVMSPKKPDAPRTGPRPGLLDDIRRGQ
jgi:hypothetical protein